MGKSLLIVESPAKAKTIEKYLDNEFIVKSSIGHIRDLPKSGMSIDIDNGFIPNYEVTPDKKKTVNELKKLAKDADSVWLATDEDREGEAIAWHLYEALNLEKKDTKRIVFHEITKTAIKEAITKPRKLDTDLVNAQQARRVLDRLVGYELSPVLWKKVQMGLSAGRVQSVAVRLIVDRERQIKDFTPESSFKVNSILNTSKGSKFKASLSTNLPNQEEAKSFLEVVKESDLSVADLTKKPASRKPAAPFTTSTLQQEAARKLGFSVKQTMTIAQKLYETGHITYMRTDSLNLSELALNQAKDKINSDFGSNYHKRRTYTTKSANAQEAHEAIRPTNLSVEEAGADSGQKRLYELIWKRTIASQMSDAQLERTNVKIDISKSDKKLTAKGEVIKFDGFLKVYLESNDDDQQEDDDKSIIPPLTVGEDLSLQNMTARETFTRAPARYAEASLVKKLEELGIGRPSTYAPTISTIQDRKYVVKEERQGKEREYGMLTLDNGSITEETLTEITGAEKNKMYPTDIGTVVTDFLVKFFPEIVDFNFTAKVEGSFDEIARGGAAWQEMIADFYWPFHKTIKASEDIKRSEAVGQRELGLDPKTEKRVYARIGRYGAMVQLGDTEDEEEKPKFASLPKGTSLETITLEEALPLFDLPRKIGEKDGEKYETQIGRFGPYVKGKNVFVSITEDEVFSLTLEDAITRVDAKIEEKKQMTINEWPKDKISILKGKYGPYIKFGRKNIKIPKDKDPEKLTLEECKEIIENAPAKKGRARKK